MRHLRLHAWARSVVTAGALIAAAAGMAPGAAAQQKFDRLFVFGDSYADLTLSDKPDLKTPLAPAGLGLSLWRVYPLPLAENLGMKDSQIVDYAVGGARASPVGSAAAPPFLELPQQVG